MKTTALLLMVLSACNLVAKQAAAQQSVNPSAGARPQEKSATTAADLNAQIGDTLLRLTRARLELAARFNAKTPGTILPDDLAIINEEIKAIDEQQQRKTEAWDWFSTMLGVAEISKATAEADWKRASSLREKYPTAISEGDVEIRRLQARLADLNLQRGKLAAKGTATDQQNWALLFLSVKVQELTDQIRVLEQRQ